MLELEFAVLEFAVAEELLAVLLVPRVPWLLETVEELAWEELFFVLELLVARLLLDEVPGFELVLSQANNKRAHNGSAIALLCISVSRKCVRI